MRVAKKGKQLVSRRFELRLQISNHVLFFFFFLLLSSGSLISAPSLQLVERGIPLPKGKAPIVDVETSPSLAPLLCCCIPHPHPIILLSLFSRQLK
jgi:hypothetical protein